MYSASQHNIHFYCFRYILNQKNTRSLLLVTVHIYKRYFGINKWLAFDIYTLKPK